MTTFTKDGTDEKFEIVGRPKLPSDEQEFVIRPIKEEPKWELDLTIYPRNQILAITLNTTPDQARLIEEAVEALMEYVTGPGHEMLGIGHTDQNADYIETFNKARQAMKGTESKDISALSYLKDSQKGSDE